MARNENELVAHGNISAISDFGSRWSPRVAKSPGGFGDFGAFGDFGNFGNMSVHSVDLWFPQGFKSRCFIVFQRARVD